VPRPGRGGADAVTGTAPLKKTSASSRSFHTQRNWKIGDDAGAETERGRISRMKVLKWLEPSRNADSRILRGMVLMKLNSRYVAGGRPKPVWASQMPKKVPFNWIFW
jgi:hypothetical protein